MKTTVDERRNAVAVARRLLDANEPLMLDVGEVELLCRTLLDVQAVFLVHAPVISACKDCIDKYGNVHAEYARIFQSELVPAVKALHRFDASQPKEPK